MQHLMSEVHIAAMAALWPVLVAAPGIWKVKGLKIFEKKDLKTFKCAK